MGLFSKLFKKQAPAASYDPEKLTPAIRASICTGEKVAGFVDKETKKFREVMLLSAPSDLSEFKARYGIEGEIETIY